VLQTAVILHIYCLTLSIHVREAQILKYGQLVCISGNICLLAVLLKKSVQWGWYCHFYIYDNLLSIGN